MPVIRLLSFATMMLTAVTVAEKNGGKDHIFVVKELVKLADKESENLILKEASESKREEWQKKVIQNEQKTKVLKNELTRLTKEKNTAAGQLAVLKAEKPNWEAKLTSIKAQLTAINVTQKETKDAQAAAFNLGEENQRLEKLVAQAEVTSKIFQDETALKEMSQKKFEEMQAEYASLELKKQKNQATQKDLQDAQSLAYKNMVLLNKKEDQIKDLKENNKKEIAKVEAELKKQKQKCEEQAQDRLILENEKLTETQTQKQTEEQYIKNLSTKVDLWKSMTNFLQKDLEKYKFASAQTKILYNQDKARQIVKQQEEKKNTEDELLQLNEQIEIIQKTATKNKRDADDLMKQQALAAKQAKKEAARLRKELASVRNLHNLTKAQMTLAQNQSIRAQQIADAQAKGKMMVLIEGLKLQRAKANQAMGKVQVLKAAMAKYELVNKQIGLTLIKAPTQMQSHVLSVIPLPSVDLTGNTQITNFRAIPDRKDSQELASLQQQEDEELKAVDDRFMQQEAEIISGFQSDSSVNDLASKASSKIEADRQRIIKFMENILQNYNKIQAAFKQGRITQQNLNQKTRQAKERMAYARERYSEFKEKTAVKLDSSMQSNQNIRLKLSELMSKKEVEKNQISQKYNAMRNVL